MQIAVAIENSVLRNPFIEEFRVTRVESIRKMADGFKRNRRDRLANKRLHLREIFVRTDLQFLRRTPLRHPASDLSDW